MAKSEVITWEAQEYVQHDRNAGWYVGLILVSAALIALAVFLQWWSFILLIVVATFALIVYTTRPPRVIKYKMDGKTLTEGEKKYNIADYKTFGILKDGEHYAIVLTPRKRFAPGVTVFFPEKQGEKIVDSFGARLPQAEVKRDMLDKIVAWLRI